MAHYYMNSNQQQNGDYEVHQDGCAHGAHPNNQLSLGYHSNCRDAVALAIQRYGNEATQKNGRINGCYYCSNPCHTS